MPTFSKFIQGRRGSQLLVDSDGYEYSRKQPRDTALSSAWRCRKYSPPTKCSCHAYLVLSNNSLYFGAKPHNHPADVTASERREIIESLKRKATDQPLSASRNVISETLAGTSTEAKEMLPKMKSLTRIVWKSRATSREPVIPLPPSPPPPSPQPALPRRSTRLPTSLLYALNHNLLENKILHHSHEGLQIKTTGDKGRGVFATKSFSRGEFLVEYEGELVSREEGLKRDQHLPHDLCYLFFFSFNGVPYCVDATKEDATYGRLVNHGKPGNCSPKTLGVHDSPRLYFVTSTQIMPGDEVLFDYGERRPDILKHFPFLK